MIKNGLLGTTAIGSVVFVGMSVFAAVPALAQTAQPAAQTAPNCTPESPNYDPNTRNCTQNPEGTPGQTAPGSNPGTTPSDEEPLQEELDSNASERETIVVTGSRIPRPQFEGTIPGAQVNQEQIESRAFTNALEALNDIPLVGTGASALGTNGAQPGSLGAAFVDLLDLGTNRTLTLVNGRRFVSGNQGTLFVAGNTTGSQVDLSVIPTALISRFDVLTVGGAAAYGSDAIAGVVNAILIDDYDGQQVGAVSGITEEGDAFNYRLSGIIGRNFMGDRANATVSYERVFDEALQGNRRDFLLTNFVAPTFFGNGGQRNPNFTNAIGANQNAGTGAFLPAFADQTPNNIATGIFGGSTVTSAGGTVLRAPIQSTAAAPIPQGPFSTRSGTTLATGVTAGRASVANNANLIPGTPVAAALAGCTITNIGTTATFCNFAPTGLPAGTAAQQTAFANAVVARFAPSQVGAGTQAQRNALAVQLLQSNRPTPRDFFVANPNADPNAFAAQFVVFQQGGLNTTSAFLTVPNTDPATSAILPRRAVPLFFDNSGNLGATTNCITPQTPATTGSTPCSNSFQNPAEFNILRTEQTRDIGNFFAHLDLTDNLTVYTEGLFAKVETVSPQNNVASANAVTGATGENAVLIFNLNNPFLDAADRAQLIAAGVDPITAARPTGGQFLLSRTNQDIAPNNGRNRVSNDSETIRAVGGLKGAFDLFGGSHRFDASVTYGKNEARFQRIGILDVEFALALDAVVNPANGQIVCRAQIDPAGALGTRNLPVGVNAVDVVRVPGADGIITQQIVVRSATPEQIAGCVPFNPFGFNQSSEAARQYVNGNTVFDNTNKQLFAQTSLAGNLFDLPGGPLGYALSGDYRKDKIDFRVDPEISGTGRTRSAILANTEGEVENYEAGLELRIPIFGDEFNIPLFRSLNIEPAIRFVKQDGKAPPVRLLNGTVQENESEGDFDRIYSLAGNWRPVQDITLRGNITRSLRQPSVVELFLGGQPAFNGYTDPCSSANITGGLVPAIRQANCVSAVLAAGVQLPGGIPVTTPDQAQTFLQTFTNPGNAVQGFFNGSPGLLPEKGKSHTFGVAINPSFIRGLRASADYINVRVEDQIIPTNLTRATQVCFDSPNFPDTTAQVGVNTCSFFTRGNQDSPTGPFILENNFQSGFINLGQLGVEAINMTATYDVPIADWLGANFGKLELFANAYHLIHYKSSSTGNINDPTTTFDFAGSPGFSRWEVQGRARYEHPTGFYGQWTTNWNSSTCATGVSDVCATNEEIDFFRIPSFAIHDATIGWRFGDKQRFNFQVTANNILNKQFAIDTPSAVTQFSGGNLDQFGRRFRVSTSIRF